MKCTFCPKEMRRYRSVSLPNKGSKEFWKCGCGSKTKVVVTPKVDGSQWMTIGSTSAATTR